MTKKKEVDLDNPNFIVEDGRLKCIDGSSVTKRLRFFEEAGKLDKTIPIRLVREEWYKVLNDLEQFVRCGFCQKPKHEVNSLIAGKNVFICDECVSVCVEILQEKQVEKEALGKAE